MCNFLKSKPCGPNNHNFKQFLVRIIPPRHVPPIETRGYSVEGIIDSLSEKVYEIRCTKCGKTPEEINSKEKEK